MTADGLPQVQVHVHPGIPPGTAIQKTGNMLVNLIEAERAIAYQKAEACFAQRFEQLQREVAQYRESLEGEIAMYKNRIRELEAAAANREREAEYAAQAVAQVLVNPQAPATVDPRTLQDAHPVPVETGKPLLPLILEQFGMRVDTGTGTISFQGHWVNFWKELASQDSASSCASAAPVDDGYTKPMCPPELERLLAASMNSVRRSREDRDSYARSILGVFTQGQFPL